MKSSCFLPKTMPLIRRPATRSANQESEETWFLAGNSLNSYPVSDLRTICLYIIIFHMGHMSSCLTQIIVGYIFSLGGARTTLCLFISYFPHFLFGFLKWDFPVLKSFPETRRWERQNQSLILSQIQSPSLLSYTHKKVAKNQRENTNRKSFISYYCFAL